MLNWSEYEKEEEKADRRRTILPLAAWAIAIGLILGAVLYAAKVHAAPVFQVQEKDIAITLYDEPCTLKEHVANLPYRAIWVEKGHSFEGCFGAWPDAERVVAYFSDKTIALIPFAVIKKVVAI